MLKKIVLATFAAALVVLVLPAAVCAYGACHVGYTHVGPNGAYHTSETVARGPEGAYAGGRTTAYGAGGAAYGYGAHYSTGPSSSQIYAPSRSSGYSGASSYNYSNIR
jgi:hypothetical protein